MDPLDPGLGVVQRRQQLAVASGQSGQPRPESVARTITPTVTSRIAVARVERGELLEAGQRVSWRRRRRDARPHSSAGTRRAASRRPRGRPPLGLAVTPAARSLAGSSVLAVLASRARHRGVQPGRRPASPASARRRRRPRRVPDDAAAAGHAGGLGRRPQRPVGLPGDHQPRPDAWPAARTGCCSRSSTPTERPDRRARTGRSRSRSSTSAPDPKKPVAERRLRGSSGRSSRRVGVYVLDVDFQTAGTWGAEFKTAARRSPPETIRVGFDVQPTSTVGRGRRPAPASDTPTLADVGGDVSKISTERRRSSVLRDVDRRRPRGEEAVRGGRSRRPSSVRARQCGPTLDRVKPIAAAHPKSRSSTSSRTSSRSSTASSSPS